MEVQPDLLEFFKALADANRLRMIGLLAHRAHTVDELATVLELRPSTVSHHLGKLAAAGLVDAAARGHYHEYTLRLEALHARARTLSSPEEIRHLAPDESGTDPFERKVLAAFLDERGRISGPLPMKRKKFEVVLRWALRLFDDDGPWPEREVNRRLRRIADDVASIRRGFIDHRLMTREAGGKAYRRIA